MHMRDFPSTRHPSPLRRPAIAACCALLLGACTVKEDREPCPCYLNVSFRDREHITSEVGILGWDATEVFRAGIDIADHDPYWVKAVRKGTFRLAVYTGAAGTLPADHYAVIPPGSQSDSLYAFHAEVDATGEMAFADVVLRKQFCTVHLDLRKSAEQMRDFRFLVEGGTCGFDLLSFEAVPGIFRHEPSARPGERVVNFRIPRQADESMTVTAWYGGLDAGTFPLGSYIARTGYNWSAEELQDIYVVIDLALGQVTVSVDDWEDGTVFTFIEQ